ncbi:hypothetical protein [Lichenibacterium ramalinae]|uniref:hypothetical protein n=1 Tax=Lichenibacterium ramalinae TaxID=2316527 RepID=UPI00100F63CF|nr:hypothetical protein [Lichenibacterium ramalinae]
MTIRRKGQRIRLGANTHLNLNGNGQVTSTTTKAGSATYTNFSKGGTRVTTDLGGGYINVFDTRRGRSRRPRRRASADNGLAFEVAIILTVFLVRSAWRLSSWVAGVAWRSYQARREVRRAALPDDRSTDP